MDTSLRARRRHRSWPEALKREIVAASLAPGASVSVVARQYDVNTNLVFSWRKRYGDAPNVPPAARLVPVLVTPDRIEVAPPSPAGRCDRDRAPQWLSRSDRFCGEGRRPASGAGCAGTAMDRVPPPVCASGWRLGGPTCGAGMNGLALQVQQALGRDPHAGDLYVFRGVCAVI
ncbi:MAG: transposase [Rhodospirillales bacterium]